MTALEIRKSVVIEAPVSTVWRVLTENEFIRQYMFGCNAESDWKPGSPLLWKGAANGVLYVKGYIVSVDPPQRLVYTVIDPNSSIADIPSNYLTVTYELKADGGKSSTLDIVQGDFSAVENGESRYKDAMDGDGSILGAIKKLAESI